MKRHLDCGEQQDSPSNVTKYCACHAKWLAWSILCSDDFHCIVLKRRKSCIRRIGADMSLQNKVKIQDSSRSIFQATLVWGVGIWTILDAQIWQGWRWKRCWVSRCFQNAEHCFSHIFPEKLSCAWCAECLRICCICSLSPQNLSEYRILWGFVPVFFFRKKCSVQVVFNPLFWRLNSLLHLWWTSFNAFTKLEAMQIH